MGLQLDLMPIEEKPAEMPPAKTIVVRYGYLKEIGEFPSDLTSKVGCGTKLVVRTERGTEIAEMLTTTCGNGGCNKSITRDKMLEYIEKSGGRDYPFTEQGRVLRVATTQDLLEQTKLDENHLKHLTLARELVNTHRLAMKIVDVEHLLGGERILFYFVSEHRVDFRAMVRDLAHALHTRIELRQVGARDEARLTADYEKCGQHCCCKQFLKVLTPISMRAAKVQKATLDPTKISGRCGRLMCCLRYEDQTYEELRKKLPKRNTRVTTVDKGDAWVIDGQILTQLVLVQFDDGKREAIPMEKITAFDQPKPVMADGRVMQTPNDRPPQPPMAPGEVPGGRPQRGPGGQGGARPGGGPNLRRPQPGAPAAGPAGDPLAPAGPTGGDLSGGDEIDELMADAMDDGPPAAAAGPVAAAGEADEGGDPRAAAPAVPAPRPQPPRTVQGPGNRPPQQGGPQFQRPQQGPRGPQQQQRGPGGQGPRGPQGNRNQPFRPPQVQRPMQPPAPPAGDSAPPAAPPQADLPPAPPPEGPGASPG
ncbi:MAG TPA: regulatory iron-sulfur-containing complex subunit RicT [Phycisphaerae bacterium]|nr:regulatory iron-sulfur-containing complex subunit RicT [Phycisphaerae bacterium]